MAIARNWEGAIVGMRFTEGPKGNRRDGHSGAVIHSQRKAFEDEVIRSSKGHFALPY